MSELPNQRYFVDEDPLVIKHLGDTAARIFDRDNSFDLDLSTVTPGSTMYLRQRLTHVGEMTTTLLTQAEVPGHPEYYLLDNEMEQRPMLVSLSQNSGKPPLAETQGKTLCITPVHLFKSQEDLAALRKQHPHFYLQLEPILLNLPLGRALMEDIAFGLHSLGHLAQAIVTAPDGQLYWAFSASSEEVNIGSIASIIVAPPKMKSES